MQNRRASMTEHDQTLARQIIALMDLTSLNDSDDDAAIIALCHKALTPVGPVAAVCVYPQFVGLARRTLNALDAAQIQVATVCNFPSGSLPLTQVLQQVRESLLAGADEIDVVYPYPALLTGDRNSGRELVAACKALCGDQALLKVILETGELSPLLIRQASNDAIAAGADFIKTSTGKVKVNASAEAAEIMLQVIAAQGGHVGFKPAGGMRKLYDAAVYLWLAERLLGPSWISPRHLRFGASSLLDNTLRQIGLNREAATPEGY